MISWWRPGTVQSGGNRIPGDSNELDETDKIIETDGADGIDGIDEIVAP